MADNHWNEVMGRWGLINLVHPHLYILEIFYRKRLKERNASKHPEQKRTTLVTAEGNLLDQTEVKLAGKDKKEPGRGGWDTL